MSEGEHAGLVLLGNQSQPVPFQDLLGLQACISGRRDSAFCAREHFEETFVVMLCYC
jgi:hypothetical protein